MQNVKQARRSVNQNFPQGQSQFRPRPKHPFLVAAEYQFADPCDYPRRADRLQYLKRQVCRAFVLTGNDRTAAEVAQFTGLKQRTVERTILLLLIQGFLTNVRVLAARDKHGRRLFKRERMLRRLNPQALAPVNVAVCYGQCGGHTSPKSLKSTQDSFDTDSRAACAARPRVQARTSKPYSKPEQRADRFIPRELLVRFAKEFRYGIHEADGRLGWIVKRTEARRGYHNVLGPTVRNVWRYVCAANASIDARTDEPDGLDWLIASYSFAEMFKLDLFDSYFDSID